MIGSTAHRLLVRLRAEAPFKVPADAVPERCHHGPAQRAAGAWSWRLSGGWSGERHSALDYGSQATMGQCVAAPRLVFTRDGPHWDIDPEPLPIGEETP